MKIVKTNNTGTNGHADTPPPSSAPEGSKKKSPISQFFGKIFRNRSSSGKATPAATSDSKPDTPQKPEPKKKTPPPQPALQICMYCR